MRLFMDDSASLEIQLRPHGHTGCQYAMPQGRAKPRESLPETPFSLQPCHEVDESSNGFRRRTPRVMAFVFILANV
ncbi:MAG TPA: hypothetical protein VN541_23320, partial [Tepidisphaeraceae bacterium]|nr:hypothetical protein [Tepidisphaeraceae bacterium]